MRLIRTASLRPLRNKRIAVLGYGAQGRAQALNLRDNKLRPVVGLPLRSASRGTAQSDRLTVVSPTEAVAASDIIFVLAPDHEHGRLFAREIAPHLSRGQMLVFAHASSVHFGLIEPPPDVDVVLVAPLGPGRRLRELRGRKDGVACFFAVHQNATRHARPVGLALARAIGCLPAGAIPTTFAREAVGDLFGEQAVLCGGLGELLKAAVETLIRHGHPPETAYLECVYQIDLIVDLIKSEGLDGMYRRISPTAAYGAKVAGPRIVTGATVKAMDKLYREIASGRFLDRWVRSARRAPKSIYPAVSPGYRRGERRVLRAFQTDK